jgi:hypothetical protein
VLLLVVTVVAAAVAVGAGAVARRRAGRLPFALGMALATWLVLGLGVLGYMRHISVRYIEPLNPAIAAALGIVMAGAAKAAVRCRPRTLMPVAVLVACVAVLTPLAIQSVAILRARTVDGGGAGRVPPTDLANLSRYLTRHRGEARYQFAAIEAYQAGPLIAADGQPALILASSPYHPLVSTRALGQAARTGQVRYVFVSAKGSGSGDVASFVGGSPRRAPMVRWVMSHGTDVSSSAGLPHAGSLYRLDPRAIGAG